MKPRGEIEKVLTEYNAIIDTYYGLNNSECDTIMELAKKLSIILSYLETHRIAAHEKWTAIIFKREGSVASAEIEADTQVPELYQLRRIMQAGYRVVDVMRSGVSLAKSERQAASSQV